MTFDNIFKPDTRYKALFLSLLLCAIGSGLHKGWIWNVLGIETLFIVSAVLGLCNSAYAATIKVKNKTCNIINKQ